MNRPSLLVIVRHAESQRNIAKRGSVYFADEEARATIKGMAEHKTPLTPKGIQQAGVVGQFLRRRFGIFDYIYHSGYLRTVQTVEGILMAYRPVERQRMEVRRHLFIRERDPGHAFDMTETEAERHFPWLKEYWATCGGFFAHPPGGESLAQVAERVYLFLNMLFRDRAGKKILVITHGGTLRCFRFLLERWDYERALTWPADQKPANCGVTVYKYDPRLKRLMLKAYNLTAEASPQ
ncbi:MAG: histidine phosphatase family protein [Candidatus Omnitrophica bacterium]|nr:histidine phosphatase family protein [Candidatus Omnitrophota bacterium]